VTASAGPSGTAAQTHRLGGNSEKQQRRPLDVPTSWLSSIRVSLGRPRADSSPWRSLWSTTCRGTAPCRGSECGPGLPSGGCGANSTPEGNFRTHHAECTNHACRGARMRAGPSFGAVRDNFDVLEATSVQPRRVRESRLLWACGCVLRLSRGVA